MVLSDSIKTVGLVDRCEAGDLITIRKERHQTDESQGNRGFVGNEHATALSEPGQAFKQAVSTVAVLDGGRARGSI